MEASDKYHRMNNYVDLEHKSSYSQEIEEEEENIVSKYVCPFIVVKEKSSEKQLNLNEGDPIIIEGNYIVNNDENNSNEPNKKKIINKDANKRKSRGLFIEKDSSCKYDFQKKSSIFNNDNYNNYYKSPQVGKSQQNKTIGCLEKQKQISTTKQVNKLIYNVNNYYIQ